MGCALTGGLPLALGANGILIVLIILVLAVLFKGLINLIRRRK